MASKSKTSDIVFKDEMTIQDVSDWIRYSGAKSNYEKLSKVLSNTLDNCPDFLEENTPEVIYKELSIKDWHRMGEAFEDHRKKLSKMAKNLPAPNIKFVEKITAYHFDQYIRGTTGFNPNYERLGQLLSEVIEEPELSHEEVMEWTFVRFIKTFQTLSQHFEALTSKN